MLSRSAGHPGRRLGKAAKACHPPNPALDVTRAREILPFAQDAASSRMVLNAVMQLNQTILEAFKGVQIQGHVTVTPRYQGNAIPNKHGGHTDDELVDRVLVKKGGDELAAAHQPDILAGLLSKAAYERADCIAHKLHAGRGVGWRRMTGEDDGPTLRV